MPSTFRWQGLLENFEVHRDAAMCEDHHPRNRPDFNVEKDLEEKLRKQKAETEKSGQRDDK